jgi:predicted porin
MKKHLLAAAVAAAVAVPAMAQNVTVSGNINVGLQSVDTGVQGVGSFMRSNEGGLSGSDLFIQGSEDLGGGLKAAFILRSDIPTNDQTAFLWKKERAIELSGSFGAIRIGTTDVTSAQAIDAAVSTFGDFGNTVKSTDKSGEVGADQVSVVRWTSPKMNGLTLQAGRGKMTTQGSATDANKNSVIDGLYAAYEFGPAATIYAGWTQDAGVGAAKLKDSRFGAKASVAGINLGLLIARSDAGSSALSGIKTTMMNAGYDLGAGTSAHIVYAKQKIDGTANSEGNGYTLGLQKKLSKRTTIYGAYTSSDADSASTFEMQGVGTYSTAAKKASIVTTGILHTF